MTKRDEKVSTTKAHDVKQDKKGDGKKSGQGTPKSGVGQLDEYEGHDLGKTGKREPVVVMQHTR